jgi:hypothetical protein
VVFRFSTFPAGRAGNFFVAKRQCFELTLRFPNNEFQFFLLRQMIRKSTTLVQCMVLVFCFVGQDYFICLCFDEVN